MAEKDSVGVVVITYNSRAHFARQKAALEAQTHPFHLIVIDNASKPDQRPTPADFPAGADVRQMEENLGFAAGNNRAVDGLDTEFVALLNPDAFPAPDWLERLVAAARAAPDAAAFGSTQVAAGDDTRFDGLGDCYHVLGVPWRGGFGWPVSAGAREGACFSPCAAAALYRADVWRTLGGFDESFFCYCEDVDLGFRMRLAGHDVRQVADAVVHHVGGASSGNRSYFAVYHGTRNRLWTFVKNMPSPAFWLLLPAHIAVTLAFLSWSPFRGTGRGTWVGVIDALKGLGSVWRARRAVQRARRARGADVLSVMAFSPLALLRRAPVVFKR
jgi:GT2 family glycosyltransferase